MQDIRDNKFFSKLSTFGAVTLVLISISAIVYFGLKQKGYFLNTQNKDKDHLASIQYICDDKKSLTADFYELKTPVSTSTDQNTSQDNSAPPTPIGSVVLKLSDGRNLELNQTVSADGGRYENQDESFVFWEKGDTVIILEFDTEKYYKNCKKNILINSTSTTATSSQNQ